MKLIKKSVIVLNISFFLLIHLTELCKATNSRENQAQSNIRTIYNADTLLKKVAWNIRNMPLNNSGIITHNKNITLDIVENKKTLLSFTPSAAMSYTHNKYIQILFIYYSLDSYSDDCLPAIKKEVKRIKREYPDVHSFIKIYRQYPQETLWTEIGHINKNIKENNFQDVAHITLQPDGIMKINFSNFNGKTITIDTVKQLPI